MNDIFQKLLFFAKVQGEAVNCVKNYKYCKSGKIDQAIEEAFSLNNEWCAES